MDKINIIADISIFDLSKDQRFLIPIMEYKYNNILFGFVDKNGKQIIQPIYDKIFDDFYCENDLIRVGKRFCVNYGTKNKPRNYYYFTCGIINSKGEEIIPCDTYEELYFTANRTLLIAYGSRFKQSGCALIDLQDNILIPFGKYSRIYSFAHGFARTLNQDGWGITDFEGNPIIHNGDFELIWDLNEKYRTFVVQKANVRYVLPFEVLKKIKDEIKTEGKVKTSVEDYLEYKDFLQHDFTQTEMIPLV